MFLVLTAARSPNTLLLLPLSCSRSPTVLLFLPCWSCAPGAQLLCFVPAMLPPSQALGGTAYGLGPGCSIDSSTSLAEGAQQQNMKPRPEPLLAALSRCATHRQQEHITRPVSPAHAPMTTIRAIDVCFRRLSMAERELDMVSAWCSLE